MGGCNTRQVGLVWGNIDNGEARATMTSTIKELDGGRSVTIEADNEKNPDLVFLIGPNGLAMEFDRNIFLNMVRRELRVISCSLGSAEMCSTQMSLVRVA